MEGLNQSLAIRVRRPASPGLPNEPQTNNRYAQPLAIRHPRIVNAQQIRTPWEAYTKDEIDKIIVLYPLPRYRQLHIERKWARRQNGSPFPFMQLPPEIRIQVYELLLVRDEPIELWPHSLHNMMYASTTQRTRAFARYRTITRNLRILRVSKAFHSEASDIFYGKNEFRFSAINAWMVFAAFLNTVGARHFRLLQRVTIHIPFPGREYLAMPTYKDLAFTEKLCISQSRTAHLRKYLRRQGLRVPEENWHYFASITNCMAMLSTSKLRFLKLVHTPTYHVDHTSIPMTMKWCWGQLYSLKCTVDAARDVEGRAHLRVGFIFLKNVDGSRAADKTLGYYRPWAIRYRGQVKRMMEILRNTTWVSSLEYGIHDRNGRYDVMDKDACQKITGRGAMELEEILEEDDW